MTPLKNYIAFCLWGSDPKYCAGACKNVHLARHWYPSYTCAFWIGDNVPSHVTSYLQREGALLFPVDPSLDLSPMFHRFLVNDLPDCSRYLVRDTDSRICEREVRAVQAWESSNLPFHVIRDHPHHNTAILGGTWGATKGLIPSMRALFLNWNGPRQGYDPDQAFLRQILWPLVKDRTLQHDTCNRPNWPGSVPPPAPLSYTNPRFVGEVFDARDRPRLYDWEKMLMWVHPASDRHSLLPPLFIRPHLGLGDLLLINALVRAKAALHETVTLPVKHTNLPTAKLLFSDTPNILLTPVTDDREADTLTPPTALRLGMFNPTWNGGNPGWDRLMYDQADLPFDLRWSAFTAPHSQTEHTTPVTTFALLHEDPERGFTIPHSRRPRIPTITLWPSSTLLDHRWLIEHATEIHMIDSAPAILADSLTLTATRLVLHLYARPGAKPPTYRQNWEILHQ